MEDNLNKPVEEPAADPISEPVSEQIGRTPVEDPVPEQAPAEREPGAPISDEPAEKPRKEKKKKKKVSKKGCCIAVVILLVLLGIAAVIIADNYEDWLIKLVYPFKSFDATEEKLAEISPIDEDEAAAIDAMPSYSPDDTWAVYVYLIGSDLESLGMNNLSTYMQLRIEDEVENTEPSGKSLHDLLIDFADEIEAKGSELPGVFFNTQTNDPSDEESSAVKDDPDKKGYASADFVQMTSVALGGNVKVVVQTGGAARWQNININPNKTQRWLMDQNGVKEIGSVPAINMSTPDNLADFLTFCTTNYPADHSMVLFWDHGGGYSGFGVDENYGSILSLKDLHDALEKSVGYNPANPYFEAIGFDACLMANSDVVNALYGFSRYLLASEETEPGTGWDHEAWLTYLNEHPEANGAQLGKVITDSYMDASNGAYADLGYVSAGTFSVLEMNEAKAACDAYAAFMQTVLREAIKNPSVISEISAASKRSVFFAGSAYNIYNLVDLGLFMDNVTGTAAAQAENVSAHLRKAVLYHRGSSYLKEAQGLSVYFPADTSNIRGLAYMLDYINNINDNQDLNAFYYYKTAGVLNDALEEYVVSSGYGQPQPLIFSALDSLSEAEVTIGENGRFSVHVSPEQISLLQDAVFQIGKYDEESGEIIYYGEDRYVALNLETNEYVVTFDGKWGMLGDVPLALEIVDSTEENVLYKVPMEYNLLGSVDFLINYNYESGENDFIGIRSDLDPANLMGRDLIPLDTGAYYAVSYMTSNLNNYLVGTKTSSTMKFNEEFDLSEKPLADGTYLALINFEDIRSDSYYSPVVKYTIKDGTVTECELMSELGGYDSNKQ